MRTERTLNFLLILLFLTVGLRAEDPPNRHVGVLDPATGKPLGHDLLMRSTHDGKQALWECVNGQWSFIFDYEVKGQSQEELDALFARHGFSPRMRKQLTTDSLETVYRVRGKPLPPLQGDAP